MDRQSENFLMELGIKILKQSFWQDIPCLLVKESSSNMRNNIRKEQEQERKSC